MKLKKTDTIYKDFDFDMANIIGRGVRDIKNQLADDINDPYGSNNVFNKLHKLAILGEKIRIALEYERANIIIKENKK